MKLNNKDAYHFYFSKIDGFYLITNDASRYLFLTDIEFNDYVSGNIAKESNLFIKLVKNYFLIDSNKEIFINNISKQITKAKGYLFEPTQLHIFVLTNSCNLRCEYCQTSAEKAFNEDLMMSEDIAEKSVDIAFQSPSKNLTFEFQGGEPTLNFKVLKHLVNYSKSKNVEFKKNIHYCLITNLTQIKDFMIDFLMENDIDISTSIDGNSKTHDLYRNFKGKPTLEIIENNIDTINKKYISKQIKKNIQAIQTTTRSSLNYPKEIVDEYIKNNIKNIFIRPLTPIGRCRLNWDKLGYSAEEFCKFYEKCLDYIMELNRSGHEIKETFAFILLRKILFHESLNYMELRSPCGAVIGQIAYNFDGDIYSCDEGRMLAQMGDNSFRIGNVYDSNLRDLLENSITKTLCISSNLETIPGCSDCVFTPYCGVCPVYNLIENKSIFNRSPNNYRCKIYKGILQILFKKLMLENNEKIFRNWFNYQS